MLASLSQPTSTRYNSRIFPEIRPFYLSNEEIQVKENSLRFIVLGVHHYWIGGVKFKTNMLMVRRSCNLRKPAVRSCLNNRDKRIYI